MSGLPYYKRYTRDILDQTAGLPLSLKGPYSLLIDLIMHMGDRGLPDDPHFISGHLGCSVRMWNSTRKKLIEIGLIYSENDIISSLSADYLKINQSKYRDNQAENARGPNKNKGLQKPPPTTEKTRDTDTDIHGGRYARAREVEILPDKKPPPDRVRVLAAMGLGPDGQVGPSRTIGGQGDMHILSQWRTDLELSLDQIEGVIREVMAKKHDGPPVNFRYFTPAMQRLAGELRAPPIEPSNVTRLPSRRHSNEPSFSAAHAEYTRRIAAGEIDLGPDPSDPFAGR